MVSTSKILTVSYGTFSCTLEGFDDPFSTMRLIAEYFRDLAADDRYFGAEPPTPDAEMLHRIAERALRRPVEARIEDNNVVLRQAGTAVPEGEPTRVAGETLLEERAGEAEATETAEGLAGNLAETGKGSAPPPQGETDEAGKAGDAAKPAASTARKSEKAAKAGKKARKKKARKKKARAAAEAKAEAKAARAARKDGPEPAAPEPAAPEPAADAGFTDGSIAAKLQRIRAVVETGEGEAAQDDADLPNLEDFYADLSGEGPGSDDLEHPRQPDKAAAQTPVPIARVMKVRRQPEEPEAKEAAEASAEDMTGPDMAEPAGKTGPKTAAAPAGWETEQVSTLSPEDEAALRAELAQVEAEIEQAAKAPAPAEDPARQADGQEGEADKPKATDKKADKSDPPTRTAFDDGHIEGAGAIDRILAETDAKLQSAEANQKRASIAHMRAAVQARRAEEEEARDAPSQTPLLLTSGAGDAAGEYREDLEQVVRPKPGRGPRRGRRSGKGTLAPLVLVSEQRVDGDRDMQAKPTSSGRRKPGRDAEADKPVRPRRVSLRKGGDGDRPAPSREKQLNVLRDFTLFAAEAGAAGTEELLEAAAAFRVYVVGQETFSRPQVMGLVLKSHKEAEITREEGLRAFGRLIRTGVIRKIQRGRYTVSEKSRFRPGQTRASA